MYFSQFWSLRSPRSRFLPIQLLVMTLFLACKGLAVFCYAHMIGRERVLVSLSFLKRAIIWLGKGHTPVTLYNLYHFIDPVFKSSHSYWGLGLQHEFWGDTVQSIAISNIIKHWRSDKCRTWEAYLLYGLGS